MASVLREIKRAVIDDNVGFIDFEDENLTLDRDWFMELIAGISALRKMRNFELRAMNGLYPPSLDEAMIVAMRMAGFKTLNLAVGSFDKGQLKQFRRPDVSRAHALVLQLCQKHGLEAVSYIIAGAPRGSRLRAHLMIFWVWLGNRRLRGCRFFIRLQAVSITVVHLSLVFYLLASP